MGSLMPNAGDIIAALFLTLVVLAIFYWIKGDM